MILDKLKHTTIANKLFVEWYNKNNWQLTISIADFFKLHFRYQAGIFEDFVAAMNIGIVVTPTGYILYVIDSNVITEDMYFLTYITDKLYILASNDVLLQSEQTKSTAANIMLVRIEAVVEAFTFINNIKTALCNK